MENSSWFLFKAAVLISQVEKNDETDRRQKKMIIFFVFAGEYVLKKSKNSGRNWQKYRPRPGNAQLFLIFHIGFACFKI